MKCVANIQTHELVISMHTDVDLHVDGVIAMVMVVPMMMVVIMLRMKIYVCVYLGSAVSLACHMFAAPSPLLLDKLPPRQVLQSGPLGPDYLARNKALSDKVRSSALV